jgi:hypothetical protein
LASLLDPATLPDRDAFPDNWICECDTILRRLDEGNELAATRNELLRLVAQHGVWGDHVKVQQAQILTRTPQSLTSLAHKIVKIQQLIAAERPHLFWETMFYKQFPLLQPIASRLLVMSTQSADVERVCKANKVIYTKARKCLKNKTVQMLLYCYTNLRLINKTSKNNASKTFLEQAVLDHVEEDNEQTGGTANPQLVSNLDESDDNNLYNVIKFDASK